MYYSCCYETIERIKINYRKILEILKGNFIYSEKLDNAFYFNKRGWRNVEKGV